MSEAKHSDVRAIRAIIFDLDGVIRDWDVAAEAMVEAKYGLPPGAIVTAAIQNTLIDDVITGVISDEEWREAIVASLARQYGDSARTAVAEWSQEIGSVNREVLAYVDHLRGRFVVALLSNATSRLANDLRLLELTESFDHVFNTSEIGVAKPNPDVYVHVAQQLELASDEWLFIDDILENVEAAQALGVRAHQFRDLATLRDWIDAQTSAIGE